jgi:exosortase/archaeosortase family protein
MALFSVAVIAFPGKLKQKLIGVFSGIIILYVLNQLRIVSLYLTGIYYPKAFELMHVEVWQFLFIIFAIALWVIWIKWTRTMKPHAE